MASTLPLITSFLERSLIGSINLIPESPPTVSGLDLQLRSTLLKSTLEQSSRPVGTLQASYSSNGKLLSYILASLSVMRLVKTSILFLDLQVVDTRIGVSGPPTHCPWPVLARKAERKGHMRHPTN